MRCLLVLYTGDAKLAVVCWSAVGVGGLQQRRPLRAVSHWRPALSRLLEATLSQALSEASPGREGRIAAGHGASPCLQSYAARCDDLLRHGHVTPREAAWLMAPSFGLLRSSGAALAPIVRSRAYFDECLTVGRALQSIAVVNGAWYSSQASRHAAAKLLAQLCRLQSASADVSAAQQLACTLADFSVAEKLLPLLTQSAEPQLRAHAIVAARAALSTGFSQCIGLWGDGVAADSLFALALSFCSPAWVGALTISRADARRRGRRRGRRRRRRVGARAPPPRARPSAAARAR